MRLDWGFQDMQDDFIKGTGFLVTGVAGFIGSNIAGHLLGRGAKVTGLDDFSTGRQENIAGFLDDPSFTLIRGDIRNKDDCAKACSGIACVLHQAALGSVPRSIKDPETSTRVNVDGTLNMMLAARDAGVKRFVYASSSSVYGDDPRLPKKEGNEGRLLSPYAVTKHVNELHGRLFFELYGLETVGLRYFNVFGPHQDPDSAYAAVIPLFVRKLMRGEQPHIHGDGRQSRDFTFVENVIQANLLACRAPREACGKAYNVAFGGRVYLIDLYNKLCSLLGKSIDPIFAEDRPGDIKHSLADISEARHFLSYDPKVSFDEGIEKTIEWYKRNLV
jgi:UDP-N-acetylglucosamine/UDP-N-acetylgalactosamine 4-epimerase